LAASTSSGATSPAHSTSTCGGPSARRGKPRGLARFRGFFREAAGPGWALVGDAGHFKDPSVAQGIADAFRQAETLSEAIVAGLGGARPLDGALREWWRWRDRAHTQRYWLGYDFSRSGPVPRVVLEILRGLSRSEDGRREFWDMFLQRRQPAEVLTPSRLVAATSARLRGAESRRSTLAEVRALLADDVGRRILARRPRYETGV
jgi:flavin-dependent dehydrogenase